MLPLARDALRARARSLASHLRRLFEQSGCAQQPLSTSARAFSGEKDAKPSTSTSTSTTTKQTDDDGDEKQQQEKKNAKTESKKQEIGGPKGPEPTRYNDWERKGRVSDF